METHYFLHYSYGRATNNKLQAACLRFLQSLGNVLIEKQDLDDLETFIKSEVEKLNLKFKNCTPIKISLWRTGSGNIRIEGFAAAEFHIYPAIISEIKNLEIKAFKLNENAKTV